MQDLSKITVADYEVHDVRIRPEEMVEEHSQETWEIALVTRGAGTCRVDGIEGPFASGELIVVPPGVSHGYVFDPRSAGPDGCVTNIAVMVAPAWLRRVTRPFAALAEKTDAFLAGTRAFRPMDPDRDRIDAFLRACAAADASLVPLRILELVAALASLTTRAEIAPPRAQAHGATDRLAQTRIYITCNFRRKVTLAGAARNVGMSRTAFCAWFKKEAGVTFSEAVDGCRIDEACRLLRTTNLSVSEIALRAGFTDPAYFNRRFRARLNTTPRAWRESNIPS